MKNSFKKLLVEPFCLWGLTFSLIVLFLALFFLILFWRNLPPQIPLFYSYLWGEKRLGTKEQILLLPGLAFLFFLINLSLAVRFAYKEPLLARILIWTNLFLAFVNSFALIQILRLVG